MRRTVVTALVIRELSSSIRYRPWLADEAWPLPLQTALAELRERCPDPFVVMLDARQHAREEALVRRAGVPVVERAGSSDARALLALARRQGASAVVSVHLEAALAPADLIPRLTAIFDEGDDDWLTVSGLPPVCTPLFVSAALLEPLDRAQSPSLPSNLRSLVGRLERTRALDAFARRVIDLPTLYPHVANAVVPRRVMLETADDVRHWADAMTASAQGLGRLHAWHRSEACADRPRPLAPTRSPARTPGGAARRVLFVSAPSLFSGAEESLCQLVAHLDPTRYEASALIGFDGWLVDRLRQAGAQVICTNRPFWTPTADTLEAVLTLLDDWSPDVVHCNGFSGMAIAQACHLRGIPLVHHVRTMEVGSGASALKASRCVITVSEMVRQSVLPLGCAADKVHVVYNGIDIAPFASYERTADEARQTLGLPLDRPVIVKIARFAPNKRHDLALDVFARALEAFGPAHLVFVGEPTGERDTYDQTRRQIDAKGLAPHVTITGWMADPRLALRASDALLLCSQEEPFARCVLEALAMGVPVVMSQGGFAEVVDDCPSVHVVTPGTDAAALAAALTEVLRQDAGTRARHRERGRRLVSERLTSTRMAEETMRLFDQVCQPALSQAHAR